jgi:hypothetical protein
MGGSFRFVGFFTEGFVGVTTFATGTAVIVETEVETEAATVDIDTAGTAVEAVEVDITGAADAAVAVKE